MFQGSMVALVTPMTEDGTVDEQAMHKLVDWHVEQGTSAIVAVGTTGESATLDEKEHCDVIRQVVEFCSGRVPVIAGTGANSTTEAINLTRCAKEAGVAACLLVTPYYNKPTQEGLFLHHQAVATAVNIPQILYNVPGRTSCDMVPDTVARLSQIENIIGIKEATGDVSRVSEIRTGCGPDFNLYSGDDATACEFILAGGQGVISVTSNIAPQAMSKMCQAALDGDRELAQSIDQELAGLHRDLFLESNPIPVKWALAEMGRIPTGIRLPLTWLSENYQSDLRNSMQQAGII